jgi:hypothetical protein
LIVDAAPKTTGGEAAPGIVVRRNYAAPLAKRAARHKAGRAATVSLTPPGAIGTFARLAGPGGPAFPS